MVGLDPPLPPLPSSFWRSVGGKMGLSGWGEREAIGGKRGESSGKGKREELQTDRGRKGRKNIGGNGEWGEVFGRKGVEGRGGG